MPTKDFDPTQLQHWTVEIDGCSSIHVSNSEPEYTYTYDPEREWIVEGVREPIKELTFRQKLALEWIIFKAWIKRVFGLD